MKKLFIALCAVLLLVGCTNKTECSDCELGKSAETEQEASTVKEHYEQLNGTEGFVNVLVEDNEHLKLITIDELTQKLDKKGSFILLLGSNKCNWCRSSIGAISKVADKDVFVLEAWDKEGNEIFRDKYNLNAENELGVQVFPHDTYKRLLELDTSQFFKQYVLTDDEGIEHDTMTTRIYLPTLMNIKDGAVITHVTNCVSDYQESSTQEITDELEKDMLQKLKVFFEE